MLAVLTVLAVVVFLRFTRGLMIPIIIALLISCAAAPLVAWLDRIRIPRWLGAGIVVVLITAVAAAGAFALGGQLSAIAERLPEALEKLRGDLASSGPMFQAAGRVLDESMSDGALMRGSASAASLAADLVVVFFLVYFLLFAGDRYAHLVVTVASRPNRKITSEILGDIYAQIRRFLMVQLLTSVVVGVATFALLIAIGVEHAAFWSVLAGVGNTIPYFGPVIVSGGLAVVAMMQFGGTTQAVWVSAGALAITSIEGWLIVPPLMGRAERMNVIAVFVGLLVWSWIWGVWGTILAVPMLAVMKAVADHVHPLQPFGELLGELPERKARPPIRT
ncbi:MAG: AI-2E family transporter [Vicinamibacterales bacterium]